MIGLGKVATNLFAQTERKSFEYVQKKEDLYQVNGSMTYGVKVQTDDANCNILSACTLEDGTILLSDYKNNKLKRLHSTTYTVIDSCDLPGRPRQVCSINKQQAAVCLSEKHEVHFISLIDKMNLTTKIETDFDCYGLAYADGNLYISDKNSSVYIYSMSGTELKQFSRNQSGQEIFADIKSLAVSQDGSKIYVCDFDKGLITLDRNGTVVGGYNDSELDAANDSCTAGEGSLLACGWLSNNVLQFGMNSELIGEVVNFGDINIFPTAVCCNQQMSKMIICQMDKNEVVVFDLCNNI